MELLSFLSKALVVSFKHEERKELVTDGDQVICVPAQQNMHLLAPCNHEEADSRMMLHVAHAARHDHHQILVRTVDTDIVVLTVMVTPTLPAGMEIWLAFGVGKYLRYLVAHQMVVCLRSEKSHALQCFMH